jgi:DNA-binding CsgD family transcriptional regulator/sulfur carrier protein ThiS
MKRGISAVISDILQAEVVFIDELEELNHYLETNSTDCVFIDVRLLQSKDQREIFLQLRGDARLVALTVNNQTVPASRHFHKIMDRNASKEEIIPVLEKLLAEPPENKNKNALLSERETEVLKQVALGYTNQQIADRLFISRHTVISHRKNITSKLGIKTVSGLTVYAVLNNLIPRDQIE